MTTTEASNDLDRIRVRYVTVRDAPSHARAAIARELERSEAREGVLLQTCHRVELLTVDGPERGPGRAVRGRPAVRRAFEVVAGFDSAVVAEEQLIGQARAAYEAALAQGLTGPILNELCRRALRFGRRVRTYARPGTDRSLADPAAAWLLERIPADASVLVVGTGVISRQLGRRIAATGRSITVASRAAARGRTFIEEMPGGPHRLVVGRIEAGEVERHAAIALGVRSAEPILHASQLERARPWVVDVSQPSAVDGAAIAVLGERFLGIDQLARSGDARSVLDATVARRLRSDLDREVDAFVRWLEARRSVDALALLRAEGDAVRERHLERLRRSGRLDERQLEEVAAAASAMIGELLHRPTVALRRGGPDADAIRRLFEVGS